MLYTGYNKYLGHRLSQSLSHFRPALEVAFMRGVRGVEALFTEVFKHLFDFKAMGEITQTVLCGEYVGEEGRH